MIKINDNNNLKKKNNNNNNKKWKKRNKKFSWHEACVTNRDLPTAGIQKLTQTYKADTQKYCLFYKCNFWSAFLACWGELIGNMRSAIQ